MWNTLIGFGIILRDQLNTVKLLNVKKRRRFFLELKDEHNFQCFPYKL